jgi:L-fuculose-phosphate aldolase
MKHQRLRRQVIDTALRMNELGINQGTAGNVSARVEDGFLITPSGMAYEQTRPVDLVHVGFRGHGPAGNASSEWRIHFDIYTARSEVNAVVHTHAMFCTTLACLRKEIPAFHYMVAVAGGDSVRCAPYATFGTQRLSSQVLKALRNRKACLLANHGMIAVEASLERALALAVEVETLAAQYWRTLQIGEPHILSSAEMKRVLEKFKTYGVAATVR